MRYGHPALFSLNDRLDCFVGDQFCPRWFYWIWYALSGIIPNLFFWFGSITLSQLLCILQHPTATMDILLVYRNETNPVNLSLVYFSFLPHIQLSYQTVSGCMGYPYCISMENRRSSVAIVTKLHCFAPKSAKYGTIFIESYVVIGTLLSLSCLFDGLCQ